MFAELMKDCEVSWLRVTRREARSRSLTCSVDEVSLGGVQVRSTLSDGWTFSLAALSLSLGPSGATKTVSGEQSPSVSNKRCAVTARDEGLRKKVSEIHMAEDVIGLY